MQQINKCNVTRSCDKQILPNLSPAFLRVKVCADGCGSWAHKREEERRKSSANTFMIYCTCGGGSSFKLKVAKRNA